MKRESMQARNKNWSQNEEDSYKQEIINQFDSQGGSYYSTARLWDDGIIDPTKTREVLAIGLSAAQNTSIENTQYGIFRM